MSLPSFFLLVQQFLYFILKKNTHTHNHQLCFAVFLVFQVPSSLSSGAHSLLLPVVWDLCTNWGPAWEGIAQFSSLPVRSLKSGLSPSLAELCPGAQQASGLFSFVLNSSPHPTPALQRMPKPAPLAAAWKARMFWHALSIVPSGWCTQLSITRIHEWCKLFQGHKLQRRLIFCAHVIDLMFSTAIWKYHVFVTF